MVRDQFYKPTPPPIDWTTVKMPDPNDDEDQWLLALGVIVVIAGMTYILYKLSTIGPLV